MLVKICGITSVEDARAVAAAGADYIGLIFVSASKRCVTPEVAAEIVSAVRGQVESVGVFVDRPAVEIAEIAMQCKLDHVQVHGDETPEDVTALQQHFSVIKALALREPADLAVARRYDCTVLVDAVQGAQAGAGVVADWGLAAKLAQERPILLAGGLTADTVTEAIRTVRPAGVDVSTGVEIAKGIKDHELVNRFVKYAREAAG